MVGTFLALAVGQLLISWIEVKGVAPFNVIVNLFAVALVMVSTTRAEPPLAVATEKLPYGQLTRAAPVAVIGCAMSGLVSSAFYALAPAWMQDDGIKRETIALSMLVAVVGGLVFQVPVGRLSDRYDRRIVLAALGFGFACAAIALVHLPRSWSVLLPAAALLGGFMSTLYPVCVADAPDCMPANRVVAISGQLILVWFLPAPTRQQGPERSPGGDAVSAAFVISSTPRPQLPDALRYGRSRCVLARKLACP